MSWYSQSGRSYWMKSFWICTRTELWSNVMMACIAVFSPVSLPIPRTTLRSTLFSLGTPTPTNVACYRVLLATIRDKGNCPCPKCLIPKSNFARLGLLSDLAVRTTKICEYFLDLIVAAHDTIYKQGVPIKGSVPEHYLKPFSLVPTFVSELAHIPYLRGLRHFQRTLLPTFWATWDVMYSRC